MGNTNSSEGGKGKTTLSEDIDSFWATLENWAKGASSSEQTLDKVALGPGADWQEDEDADECNLCDCEFTVFRRRHHCRHCGYVFCADCSDNFITLNENSVRFKLRICQDCNTDADTTVNIREGASSALEAIMQAASDALEGSEDEPQELELHRNAQISKALGIEDGEELTVQLGGVDSAHVILPDEFAPFEHGQEQDESEWWEESYFDGEFTNARGMGYTTVRDMPMADQERFLAYSDQAQQVPVLGNGLITPGITQGTALSGLDSDPQRMNQFEQPRMNQFDVSTVSQFDGGVALGPEPEAGSDGEEFEGLE